MTLANINEVQSTPCMLISRFKFIRNFRRPIFAGDSYLVLHTEKSGAAKTYELHFWLGAKTSQVSRAV